MTGSRIVVVGDVINDIVAVPRIPVRPDTDTPSSIRPRPGGSAANTAVWLGSRGAAVDFVGAVGAHDAAEHAAVGSGHIHFKLSPVLTYKRVSLFDDHQSPPVTEQ